ncbi:multisubunit sodium/proton antiporter MrpC subunit [Glaciihabitans tibetensis]|uniref:Multisubunit sodium/proton antiporter MrpC subunit n=1 Tax=Glaciihabitans tibetensis TaxID=1266600 RepID=A0A2T0VFM6_9MICO|nr:Na(+)/H(+) antiporter subunit C [Glaciihabitans tibetensis]PRY69017.1 multisubunit sodium/proton antiporter MrpC subunit [Glaciihabitans tibetensis]
MSISLVLLIVMAVMYACGIFLLLERSMTRVLLGFLLVGNATNLLILIMGGEAGLAPIVGNGVTAEEMSDPLPQALILTAIVITFAVSAFLMALIYRSWRIEQDDDLDDDAADVAMRDGVSGIASETMDTSESDTEFGIRAEAAVSTARDLERSDELAAAEAANSVVAKPVTQKSGSGEDPR